METISKMFRRLNELFCKLDAQKIYHRHLTLDSFVIEKDDIFLLDIGWMHYVEPNTTLLYRPPEQIENEAESKLRVDQWSIGVILYQLFDGHLPFLTTNAIIQGQFSVMNTIPIYFLHLLNCLMDKKPKKRWSWERLMYHKFYTINLPQKNIVPLIIQKYPSSVHHINLIKTDCICQNSKKEILENPNFVKCLSCKEVFCRRCLKKRHDGQCPDRIEKINDFTHKKNLNTCVCPYCLEIQGLENEIEIVKCENCQNEFYFCCSAPAIPIKIHGAHYHRKSCINYKDSGNETYFSNECDKCKIDTVLCNEPANLVHGDIPFSETPEIFLSK